MTQHQENVVSSWTAVDEILKDYENVWKGNPGFSRAVTSFRAEYQIILPFAQHQQELSGNVSITKDLAWENLIVGAFQMANNVRSYAVEAKLPEIEDSMTFTETELRRMRDNVLPLTVQSILDAATEVLASAADFMVTSQTVADLSGLLTAFKQANPTTRKATIVKSTATVNIALHITAGTIQLDQMERLIGNFRKTSPDFILAFEKARIVIELGARRRKADKPTTDTNPPKAA